MINNRTNSRRRGRGGARPNTSNNRGGNDGSRLDSRARGNAHQLLEKYKAMARDAQNQGDRVVQEYYLQFADHYFRILSEANARSDEHRRQREGARDEDQDGEDQRDGDSVETALSSDREQRAERQPSRSSRGRTGRPSEPRDENRAQDEAADERIEVARLPAAINAFGANPASEDDDAPRTNVASPRTRSRSRTAPKAEENDGAREIDA